MSSFPSGSERKKCHKCGKKLKLFEQYECKCQLYFCTAHRFKDTHNCIYNHDADWKEELSKKNPKITSPKLPNKL